MKAIFYLTVTFLAFSFFLFAGINKPVFADWTFDPNFPTCTSWIFNPPSNDPNTDKGNTITITVNAQTAGPSTMKTITLSSTTPSFGSFGAPSYTYTDSPSNLNQQGIWSYYSNPGLPTNIVSLTAEPENEAGNVGYCPSSYQFFFYQPWLKTTGGDVHANQ